MGGCDIKLTLHNNRPLFFTSLDTLRGKVELNVTSEIAVENVQVKFEGFAKTKLEVRERVHHGGSGNTRTQVKRESHTLVYKAVTLFPPPNVREVSDNKKFTLTPGKYEYDFDIKVPLSNECGDPTSPNFNYLRHLESPLPPNVLGSIDDMFSVQYILKVTVRRASWFKTNIREIKIPQLRPFDPIDELISFTQPIFLKKDDVFKGKIPKRIALTEKPKGPESYKIPERKSISGKSSRFLKSVFGGQVEEPNYAEPTHVPFTFEVRASGPFVTVGQSPNIGLFISSRYGPDRYKGIDHQTSGLGAFYLQSLRIELEAGISLIAENARKHIVRSFPIVYKKDINLPIDLADLEPSPLSTETSNVQPYELEIERSLFQDAVITNNLTPSFKVCNIDLSYRLKVTATFVDNINSWSAKKIEVLAPIALLSGIPAPEEYIEMRQIPPHIAQQVLKNYPREMHGSEPLQAVFSSGDGTAAVPFNISDSNGNESFNNEKVDEGELPSYQSATK